MSLVKKSMQELVLKIVTIVVCFCINLINQKVQGFLIWSRQGMKMFSNLTKIDEDKITSCMFVCGSQAVDSPVLRGYYYFYHITCVFKRQITSINKKKQIAVIKLCPCRLSGGQGPLPLLTNALHKIHFSWFSYLLCFFMAVSSEWRQPCLQIFMPKQ